MVLWLESVIEDLDFFLSFWSGSSSYWLLIMGLSLHGPKVAATAPGFSVSNANKSRKQCIRQYIKKEIFLVFSFIQKKKKTFPRSPPSTELDHRASPECEGSWDSHSLPAMEVSGKGWGPLACSLSAAAATPVPRLLGNTQVVESWNHSEVMLDFKKARQVIPVIGY